MPKYKVEINGANFLINMEGRTAKHGFFTIRFVEAPDSVAAENAAVQMIRETQRLRDLVRNARLMILRSWTCWPSPRWSPSLESRTWSRA